AARSSLPGRRVRARRRPAASPPRRSLPATAAPRARSERSWAASLPLLAAAPPMIGCHVSARLRRARARTAQSALRPGRRPSSSLHRAEWLAAKRHRRQPDVRMGAYVDAFGDARREVDRTEVVEENERPDHPVLRVGQYPADL